MTIAEIHGKIAETGSNLSERMEDLLTSDVLGCLRYLPAQKALLPFLCTARSSQGKAFAPVTGIVRVYSAFWPWLKSSGVDPCEPDVVLGLETEGRLIHLVMVEAKYHAGLSSAEDDGADPNNQLARELDSLIRLTPTALRWDPGLRVASRTLLFVTAEVAMPRGDMARALDEFKRKRNQETDIFWTSWRVLPSILEEGLATESDAGRRAVLADMLALLVRKGLTMFRGVEPMNLRCSLADFQFYESGPRIYLWPGIPEPPANLCEYNYQVVNHDGKPRQLNEDPV